MASSIDLVREPISQLLLDDGLQVIPQSHNGLPANQRKPVLLKGCS